MRAFLTRTRRLIRQVISIDFSQHPEYGAVCPGTVLQVLIVESKCFCWRAKPAHIRTFTSKRGGSNMENTSSIVLREVMMSDLPIFFVQQLDPKANWMAAFTRKDQADRDAFMAHWKKILEDEANTIQTILFNGSVAGSVSSYVDEDEHQIGRASCRE